MATDKFADIIKRNHNIESRFKVGDKAYANVHYRNPWRGYNSEFLQHSNYPKDQVLEISKIYYADEYLYSSERLKESVQEICYDNNRDASDESIISTCYTKIYNHFNSDHHSRLSIMEYTGWVCQIPTNHGNWHSSENGLILCDSDLGRSYQRYIDLLNQMKVIKDEMVELETKLK